MAKMRRFVHGCLVGFGLSYDDTPRWGWAEPQTFTEPFTLVVV